MPGYSKDIILEHLQIGANGATNQIKGKAFENLAAYLFETIPGVPMVSRNTYNTFESEEIDIAFWNDRLVGYYGSNGFFVNFGERSRSY